MERATPNERDPDDALEQRLFAPLDGRPGPARRLSSAAAAKLVQSVVDAALEQPSSTAVPPEASPGIPPVLQRNPPLRRKAPRWRPSFALAAAALIVALVSAQAAALAWRFLRVELVGEEPPPLRRPAPPAVRRAEPERPGPLPPELPMQEIEIPLTASEPPPPPRPARKKARVLAMAPAPAPQPTAAPAPVVIPPEMPPEDLLALANERRSRHAWRDADAYYRAVVSRFPGTDAAMVAEVASATLHLQHLSDAAGALEAYRRTLAARPSGALSEEARWGIAEASRKLGDARGEARALRDFLANHPRSALAPAAQRRLPRIAP